MDARLDGQGAQAARQNAYLAGALLVLLIFAGLHWAAPFRLPLMVDEAIGIGWARDALNGLPFEGLRDARWLDTPIHALFRPLGPESLGLARTVTALFALLTCASAIALGRLLHSPGAGLLAGLLYAVLPYSAFFDRQVLGDPFAGAFGAVMLVAAVRLARRPRALYAVIAGVALAAAVFSKFAAVLIAPLPLLAAWLLAPRGGRQRALAVAGAALLIAAAVILIVLVVADRSVVEPYRSPLNPAYEWNWNRAEAGDGGPLPERWPATAARLAETLDFFIGWPLVALAFASGWFAVAGPRRRETLWLWAAGAGVILPLLAVTTYFPARYLSFVVMPFVVMAAVGVAGLARLIGRSPRAQRTTGAALALILLGWSLPRSVTVITRPGETAMPRFELDGYFASRYSGLGLDGVREALRDYQRAHPGPVHLIYDGVARMFLFVYWGGDEGSLWAWDGSAGQQQMVARWLVDGQSVAFLDAGGIPPQPLGAETETLGQFRGGEGQTYRLRIVTGSGPAMIGALLGEAFGHPQAHADDYAALAADLPPGERALVLYPPHQASVLTPLLAGRGIGLLPVGGTWPLDMDQASAALEAVSGYPAVSAVFFNETAGDPQRRVERWLAGRLYWQGERWYGPLRRVDYAPGPAEGFAQPVGAVYGGLAALEAAGVQRAAGPDGGLLLVRLEWRALAPIDLPYKVAAHVLGEDGQIAAQHDGTPVANLLPTDAWTPGEAVIDQFAIALPGDLAPGRYAVRVALYDGETLARLPLDGGGDSALAGEIVIPGP